MAAGNTYEAIATNTLGSAAASVTFSSIPATYTDLVVVVNASLTTGSANMNLNFNNDTSALYSATWVGGNGTSALSSRNTGNTLMVTTYYGTLQTTIGTFVLNVMNYANTTTNKTLLARMNNTIDGTSATVGLYRSTSAINRIDLITGSSTFTAGSTFTIYGIKSA
jgi:uncharacterized membrane protein